MGWLRVTMPCLLFTFLIAEMSAAAKATVVSTIPVFPQIPSNLGKNDFQVLVSVEAPKEPRLPVDLIFVHSVSNDGLLTGAKKAMKLISEQLQGTESNDRLIIVGPSDGENPVVDYISAPSEAIMENHCTARTEGITFEALLQKATGILNKEKATERAGAIIVLTDGPEGLNYEVVKLIKGRNYPVHTFGLGAKHDPNALRRIASASTGGTYSFVDDANLSQISAALAVCVGGLKNVVVPGTSVLKLEATEGVKLKKIHYEASAYKPASTESAEIKIGMLHAGETKNIIVYLDVPAVGDEQRQPQDGCGGKALLTASFFHSMSDFAPVRKIVCIERPQGFPAIQAAPSTLVLQQIVRIELIQLMVGLRDSVTSEMDLVNEMVIRWEQFVQDHQYWSGIDGILGGLQEEIDAMKVYASSYTSWVAYINSWISSYEAQRPTAMGSPSNVVGVFLTQEVKIMVQVAKQMLNIIPPKVDCPEHKCFDVNELVALILEALREKKLVGKPCREIDADQDPLALSR